MRLFTHICNWIEFILSVGLVFSLIEKRLSLSILFVGFDEENGFCLDPFEPSQFEGKYFIFFGANAPLHNW